MATVQRILVTGANGFIGSHVAALARARGLDVIPACRTPTGEGTVFLDVCDATSVDAAFRVALPSLVIHCAAYGVNYADRDMDVALAINVTGALCLLKAAARYGVQRFVHIGSCFEYGSWQCPISEDFPTRPTAIYGATKAAATLLATEWAHALSVPLVVVRPFGVWGPGEAAYRLVPQVIRACIDRSPLNLTPCEVLRDYMYVEDLAADILALTMSPGLPSRAILNVGTGRGVLLKDFILSIAKLFAGEDLMRFGALAYRTTEMPSLIADVSRVHAIIGSGPRTPLAEGVRRMVVRDRLAMAE